MRHAHEDVPARGALGIGKVRDGGCRRDQPQGAAFDIGNQPRRSTDNRRAAHAGVALGCC